VDEAALLRKGGARAFGGVAGGVAGSITNGALVWDGAGWVNKLITDTSVDPANKDGAAATPSMRTLGKTSVQAARGDLASYLADDETFTGAKTLAGVRYGKQTILGTATLAAGSQMLVNADTTAGAYTLNLPATPTTGAVFQIVDEAGKWGTNTLTVSPNGKSIDGATTNLTLNVPYDSVTLYYDGAGWHILGSQAAPIFTWPANPDVSRTGDGGLAVGTALIPTLYEVQPTPMGRLHLASLACRVTALSGVAGSTAGMAVYRVSYSAAQTFSATLVAMMNTDVLCGSGDSTGTKINDITTGAFGSGAGTLLLDFRRYSYLVGHMATTVTTLKFAGNGLSQLGYGIMVFKGSGNGVARANVHDWPATFDQSYVNSGGNVIASELLTPQGKLRM
jgi:hypothetical protein